MNCVRLRFESSFEFVRLYVVVFNDILRLHLRTSIFNFHRVAVLIICAMSGVANSDIAFSAGYFAVAIPQQHLA